MGAMAGRGLPVGASTVPLDDYGPGALIITAGCRPRRSPRADMVAGPRARCALRSRREARVLFGMADDPVAIAAGNNLYLTTVASAVQAAGLTDTLDGAGRFTAFAPRDQAFAAIPTSDLHAILADNVLPTDVLTYHVAGRKGVGSAGSSPPDRSPRPRAARSVLAMARWSRVARRRGGDDHPRRHPHGERHGARDRHGAPAAGHAARADPPSAPG